MKKSLFFLMAVVFLIAIIYDTIQIFNYGIANSQIRFFTNYVLNVAGMLSFLFLYSTHKTSK